MKRSHQVVLAAGLILIALVVVLFKVLPDHREGNANERSNAHSAPLETPKGASGFSSSRRADRKAKASDSQALEKIKTLISVKDMGGLLGVVGTFESGEFPEVWKLLGSLPDQPFVNELKQRALIRASFLEDPSTLLSVVVDSTGRGIVRNDFIKLSFSGPKVTLSELKELANGLEDPTERSAAWSGIGRSLSLRQSLAGIDFTNLGIGDLPEEKSALIAGLGAYPTTTMVGLDEDLLRARVVEAVAVAQRLVGEGSVDDDFAGDVVYEMSRNMAPKIWGIIEEAFPDVSSDPDVVARTMDRMARIYPMSVLDISLKNKSVQVEQVTKAVLNGLREDVSKVEVWFSENRDGLSPVNESAVLTGFAEHYARSGNQEAAIKWVGEIGDPAQRAVVEEKIGKIEP